MLSEAVFAISSPDIVFEEFDGDLVALDLGSGRYFGFNAPARLVWNALMAKACPSDIGKAMKMNGLRDANGLGGFVDQLLSFELLIEAFQPRHPKLAELMLRAEEDVLAYKTFPQAHWRQIHSTNPLERLNKEIKRRTNVVGIFPNEAAIRRLVGALMLEQNDEWAVTRRYMTLETVAAICEDTTMDPAKIAAL